MAKYLHGEENWRERFKVRPAVEVEEAGVEEDSNDDEQLAEDDENNKLNPPSIQSYLTQLLNGSSSTGHGTNDTTTEALEWLKIYVLSRDDEENGEATPDNVESFEGKTVSTERDAATLVNALSPGQKKEVINILCGQVHHEYQQQNSAATAKKNLLLWLQKPNCVRNFLFYKVNGLKDLMAARKISIVGRCNKEDRIAALAGTLPSSRLVQPRRVLGPGQQADQGQVERSNLDPKDLALKKILDRSFLPFQKGEDREHCSLGHRLEKPILKNWISLMKNLPDSPAPSLVVRAAYTAGLASRKGFPYAKDSIDFILLVEKEEPGPFLPDDDSFFQDDDEEKDLEVWGFEAKGRVTSRTALAEEGFASFLFNKNNRIKDDEVFEMVRDAGERFQVLQHAFVYDLDTVVLAISDAHSEIINSVIIDFSPEIKRHFGTVLKEMKKITLDWLYPDNDEIAPVNRRRAQVVQIPDNVFRIAKEVRAINGDEALQGTVNLWRTLSDIPAPFPSFARLIPAVYAFWNATKGGSDTTTKLMDQCNLQLPHANMETVASTRCLMIVLVLNHRLFQLLSANNNLNAYSSLFHYRKAASKRCTFHCTIIHCYDVFKDRLDTLQKEANKENDEFSISRKNLRQKKKVLPSRKRIDGVLPEQVTFGAKLPTSTPQRITKSVAKDEAEKDVKDMVRNCPGILMKLHSNQKKGDKKVDSRGKCDSCRHNTSWFCVGCKRWFCVDRRDTSNNTKDISLYSHTTKGKKLYFQKQCFHRAHEAQWCQQINNEEESA